MTNQIFRKGDIIKLAENGLWKFWYLDSELEFQRSCTYISRE